MLMIENHDSFHYIVLLYIAELKAQKRPISLCVGSATKYYVMYVRIMICLSYPGTQGNVKVSDLI